MLQRVSGVELPEAASECLRETELTRRSIEQLASDSGGDAHAYEETNLDESSPEHRPRQVRAEALAMDAITRIKHLGECLRTLMYVLKQQESAAEAPAPAAPSADFTQV
jgi:hypothetical protein